MTIWLNGSLLAGDAARIDPADRGFTLGDGVFETIRVERGMPLLLDRHLARLRNGAGVLGIPLRWADATIAAAIGGVVDRQEAVLRITLTRGPAPRGVLPPDTPTPTLLIAAAALPPAPPPARLVLCRTTRRNEHSPLARIKSLNYLDSILARQEAAARGADDAILLNTRGTVAETSVANLFLQLDGRWITPPVADGALPGVMREAVLVATGAAEGSIDEADLARVEAALLTSSLGPRPVAAIEGRTLDVAAAERFVVAIATV